ncbi:hypothetical protein C1645_476989 [Glomus cerebriforme]|uniref:Uncharacterized protein n=1 Tax=Glomus cerebriforme TaxID=658196 RepID=A0A397TP65_9GLOM|nr:hypothetical protein C1645_476989 [Glomus cerebriforme]
MANRPIITNGTPPLNNDHGMLNPQMVSHHQPQVNGNMYNNIREPQHPGYPPIQPIQPNNSGYIHSSEAGPQRRVSDPNMHPHNVISGSRNIPHGYVNGTMEEHPPPPSQPPRHSINSLNSSPSLLPTHSSANNQHPSQRYVSLSNSLPANQYLLLQRDVSLPNVLT